MLFENSQQKGGILVGGTIDRGDFNVIEVGALIIFILPINCMKKQLIVQLI